MHVVVAYLAVRPQNLFHFLAANVAEFLLDIAKRIAGPDMGDGVLDEGGRHRYARQSDVFQAFLVNDEITD